MNLEGITLHALTGSLQKTLLNGRINKIFMPTRSSLLLTIKTSHASYSLLADFNNDTPLFYLPETLPANPPVPPAFCMLLRKHLEDGRITKIEQLGLDRIISLEIDTIGAASQIITKKLIFELTGRNGNIIFISDNQIVDALKYVNKSMSSYRQILPNIPYLPPPPQNGFDFLTTEAKTIIDKIVNDEQGNLLQKIIKYTNGIGKFTAEELLNRAKLNKPLTKLNYEEKLQLLTALQNLQCEINDTLQGKFPVHALINKRNVMNTITLYKPHVENDITLQEFTDVNSALLKAVQLVPFKSTTKDFLQKRLLSVLAHEERKLTALHEDFSTAENAEAQKIIADTLMANLYTIKQGLNEIILTNIYDGTPMTIALNPALTSISNAQRYYKRYNKYKRALIELELQIKATKDSIIYLNSLDTSLEICNTNAEIEEIKAEMLSEGLIEPVGKTKVKQADTRSAPHIIKLSPETTIYIGKNNKQNDFVTFNIAAADDLWFHTKNIPGSHVILKTTAPKHSEQEIQHAAALAAHYSKAKNSVNVPVDYTAKKFVKKPSGSKPGFVIYTNQQTIYATPLEK